MNSLSDINVANDVGAVASLRNLARSDQEKALRAVAKQFEAMFLQQMLKASRETRWDEGFVQGEPGAGAMDTYREWRDDQLAQTLSAKGSLGLADMLVKQLMPSTPVSAQPKMSMPAQVKEEVPLPSTADVLMLHNLLRGRGKE